MDEKTTAVVFRANDYQDYDKLIKLITPLGSRQALMRGVKKADAKLRFAAMPFAFCEFSFIKKGEFYIVKGATQIEDLFEITASTDKLVAGSLILEAAFCALKQECPSQFLFMLRRIKEIIYSASHPFLPALRFYQYLIHDAGYGYEYKRVSGSLNTPIKLLSKLWFLPADKDSSVDVDKELAKKTLIKIIYNFQDKFQTEILSKKLIISTNIPSTD